MYHEFMEMFAQLADIAWLCYYKAELMCGYCENNSPDPVSSDMFYELLSEFRDIQKDVISKIDVFTTKQGLALYNAKIFHPDCNINI